MRRPSSNGRARVRVWAQRRVDAGRARRTRTRARLALPPPRLRRRRGVRGAVLVAGSSSRLPSRSAFERRAEESRAPQGATTASRSSPSSSSSAPRRCFATPPPRHLSNGRPAPRPRRPRPPMRPRPACPRGVPAAAAAPNASALADLEASRARVAPLRGSASASGSARNARIHRPVLSSRSPWYQPSNGALHSGQFLARRVAQASMHGAQNACEHPAARPCDCARARRRRRGTASRRSPRGARRDRARRRRARRSGTGTGGRGLTRRGPARRREGRRRREASRGPTTPRGWCRRSGGDAGAVSARATRPRRPPRRPRGAPRGARPIRGSRATPTRGSSPRASSRGVPAGEVTERARDDSHGLKSHATKCMAPAPRGVIIVVFLLASSTRQQPKPRRRRRASSRRPRLPPRVVPRLAAMRASPARACFSCPPSGPAPRPARSTPRRPSRVVRPDSPRVASRPRDAGAPRAGDDDDAPPVAAKAADSGAPPSRAACPDSPPSPSQKPAPAPPSSPPSSARGMTTRSPLRRAAPNHIGARCAESDIHKRLPTAAAIPAAPFYSRSRPHSSILAKSAIREPPLRTTPTRARDARARRPPLFSPPSLRSIIRRAVVTAADEAFMRRALDLAATAAGKTFPNPLVGCVIVDDAGAIVGEGYHPKAGEPHAEVLRCAPRATWRRARRRTCRWSRAITSVGRRRAVARAVCAAGGAAGGGGVRGPGPARERRGDQDLARRGDRGRGRVRGGEVQGDQRGLHREEHEEVNARRGGEHINIFGADGLQKFDGVWKCQTLMVLTTDARFRQHRASSARPRLASPSPAALE